MLLLDDKLRTASPPRNAREAEGEPIVHAKFAMLGTSRALYVIEGGPRGRDYLFFGWVVPRNEFAEFRLSELKAVRNLFDSPVERDPAFREGRLTDVVPAPED